MTWSSCTEIVMQIYLSSTVKYSLPRSVAHWQNIAILALWCGLAKFSSSILLGKIFWHVPPIKYVHYYFFKSLLNLLQYCFCFMLWFFGQEACEILAPWPGIEPASTALASEVLTTVQPGNSLYFDFLALRPVVSSLPNQELNLRPQHWKVKS